MVNTGLVGAVSAPQRTGHVCWVYGDAVEFRKGAVAFLTAGLRAGEQLVYIGGDSLDAVRRKLAETDGFDALAEHADVSVRSLQDLYGPAEITDPGTPIAAYAAATEAAVADGYAGLRVVAEATALVRTPAQRQAFVTYEHLIDRYMVRHPFSAMCAYDVDEIGSTAAAELACLHPATTPGATPFQWHAGDDVDVHLAGEIDIACEDVFDVTLARTMPWLGPPQVVVDAGSLAFIDHRGMLALERHARAADTEVVLLTDAPLLHRLATMLDLRAVRPQASR